MQVQAVQIDAKRLAKIKKDAAAARDAAWDAAWDAAGDAAWAKLEPTRLELQRSAIALVERMCAVNDSDLAFAGAA